MYSFYIFSLGLTLYCLIMYFYYNNKIKQKGILDRRNKLINQLKFEYYYIFRIFIKGKDIPIALSYFKDYETIQDQNQNVIMIKLKFDNINYFIDNRLLLKNIYKCLIQKISKYDASIISSRLYEKLRFENMDINKKELTFWVINKLNVQISNSFY